MKVRVDSNYSIGVFCENYSEASKLAFKLRDSSVIRKTKADEIINMFILSTYQNNWVNPNKGVTVIITRDAIVYSYIGLAQEMRINCEENKLKVAIWLEIWLRRIKINKFKHKKYTSNG